MSEATIRQPQAVESVLRAAQETQHLALFTPLLVGASHHSLVGFESIDLVDLCRVVVSKVHSGTDADFKDSPLRQRDDLLTNLVDWFRVAEQRNDVGIDSVSVEGHGHSLGAIDKALP